MTTQLPLISAQSVIMKKFIQAYFFLSFILSKLLTSIEMTFNCLIKLIVIIAK